MNTADRAWDPESVRAIVARHAGREGPLLPILHDIQHEWGYIPAESVPLVAAALNLSRAEVHGVVTFYHDFRSRPEGRHVVQLCAAEACQSMGCDRLAARARQRLGIGFGETTPDGAVTLKEVFCLGNCALSPAAAVDGRLHGRLTEAAFDRLLDTIMAAPGTAASNTSVPGAGEARR